MIEAFGGKGYFVDGRRTSAGDRSGVRERKPGIVNIMINPRAQRKPQQFAWLTR